MAGTGDIGGKPARKLFRGSVSWFDWALFAVLLVVSFWGLASTLHAASVEHLVSEGTFGPSPADNFQYLAWIRDASHHLLISDMFVVHGTAHDYLEPLVVLAAGLVLLGFSPSLALMMLLAPTVLALFVATREFIRRQLHAGHWPYRAALVLALFAGIRSVTPYDTWLPDLSWGYLPAILSIAALIATLISYEQARAGRGRTWVPVAFALLTSWLHPWQGEEVALILIFSEAFARFVRSRELRAGAGIEGARAGVLPLIATLTAAAIPLLYVAALEHFDPIWRLASSAGTVHTTTKAVLVGSLPLLGTALLGFVRRPLSWLGVNTRAWPPAVAAVVALNLLGVGDSVTHALSGVTIPLAVLTVEGVQRLPRLTLTPLGRRLIAATAVILVALATVPMTSLRLSDVSQRKIYTSSLITHSETRAIKFLAAEPQPGAVLTNYRLGEIIPEATNRHTYVGNWVWSVPGLKQRLDVANQLFATPQTSSTATAFVRATGVRFILGPCGSRAPLERELRTLIVSTRRFGCATVYTLRDG